jgi:lipopolysaccharide transport system ATP-binding protein
MTKPAIRLEGLGKEYCIAPLQHVPGTFYDVLSRWLRLAPPDAGETADSTAFWALRNVHADIAQGEVLGVVGRNGAGKSTLLKILTRITAPSEGRAMVRGRVASLLEVGTGFHPELTGRENIHLNATILGMRRAEIERKFDAIVAFSGVERFLDMPVKRYSSGMYVRLAFAVAAHVDADVLLVDEVLAVGDAEFQKRCLGIMGDVARGGRTVLFVSHNLSALRNLCTSGLLLKDGRAVMHGKVDDVLNAYAAQHSSGGGRIVDLPTPSGNTAACMTRLAVSGPMGELTVATPFAVDVTVRVPHEATDIGVFLHCHDATGARVFSHGSFFEESLNGRRLVPGDHVFSCAIPGDLLNAGEYSFDAFLVVDRRDVVQSEPGVLSVQLHDVPMHIEGWHWPLAGTIRPQLAWSCRSEPTLEAAGQQYA